MKLNRRKQDQKVLVQKLIGKKYLELRRKYKDFKIPKSDMSGCIDTEILQHEIRMKSEIFDYFKSCGKISFSPCYRIGRKNYYKINRKMAEVIFSRLNPILFLDKQ